jgi:hypothetical protein
MMTREQRSEVNRINGSKGGLKGEQSRINGQTQGLISRDNHTGIFAQTHEDYQAAGRLGGLKGGKTQGRRNVESGLLAREAEKYRLKQFLKTVAWG